MPTLNEYENDPGYYIRAWTSSLGNINYKLKPAGWRIIEERKDLWSGGEISWKQINALKAVGVVFTDDSGIIYPEDEKFQPDPEQLESLDLTEQEAKEFLAAIRANRELSRDKLEEICQILGVESPIEDIQERFEPAIKNISTQVRKALKDQDIPLEKTLSVPNGNKYFPTPDSGEDDYSGKDVKFHALVSGPEDVDKGDPEWEEGYDQNTLVLILVGPKAQKNISTDFTMHFVFFDEDNISAWSAQSSRELTWDIRAELYGQIGSMLPTVAQELGTIEPGLDESPEDLKIQFYQADGKMSIS